MGLVMRGAVAAAALCAGVLLTACGGSVADADDGPTTRTTTAPTTPFCAAARANSDAIRPLNALIARGAVPPAELETTVEAVRRAGSDLLVVAPADLRDDVERTVRAVEVQLDALVASGGDGTAVNRDPAVAAQLEDTELRAATQRVTAYVSSTCGAPAPGRSG